MLLFKAIFTIGGYTFVSRILGFLRDILIAIFMGAGPVADAFFVAFKLPNFFRRLFAEGAFSAAFVPMFSRRLLVDGQAAAFKFATSVLSILVVTLFLLVALVQVAMPILMLGFAPGFSNDPIRFSLAIELTRITFPYLLFISLVSLLGAVLNSLNRFAAAAATPIILNVCLIVGLLAATPYLQTPGHGLAWGVAFAGVMQFLWLIFICRREGFDLRLPRPRLNTEVKNLLGRIAPGALGAGVVQLNLLIDIAIASTLPTGAVSFLYYADRLNQLPLGVIGIAIGTALLPLLSRQLRNGDYSAAREAMNRAVEIALLFSIPAAVALIVIAEPIIKTLFEYGAFDAATTRETSLALICYAIGLPAYIIIKVLAPSFFAREDTSTPVKIGILCISINIILSLTLINIIGHAGIALATAISAWINVLFLAIVVKYKRYHRFDIRLGTRALKICFASAAMGGVLWLIRIPFETHFSVLLGDRIFALITVIFVGTLSYIIFSLVIGAASLKEVKAAFYKQSPLDRHQ